jgi:hypothetical protein
MSGRAFRRPAGSCSGAGSTTTAHPSPRSRSATAAVHACSVSSVPPSRAAGVVLTRGHVSNSSRSRGAVTRTYTKVSRPRRGARVPRRGRARAGAAAAASAGRDAARGRPPAAGRWSRSPGGGGAARWSAGRVPALPAGARLVSAPADIRPRRRVGGAGRPSP